MLLPCHVMFSIGVSNLEYEHCCCMIQYVGTNTPTVLVVPGTVVVVVVVVVVVLVQCVLEVGRQVGGREFSKNTQR
jgi:hypothetical protein